MKTLMVWITFIGSVAAQEHLTVRGQVTDDQGHGLPYVNVFFKDGDYAGDVSDERGEFEITTTRSGERPLVASMLGYKTWQRTVPIPQENGLIITLMEKTIELKEVQVEASTYTGGEGKVTLNKVDVYTTPGGAADVFQSIKALPGITQSDETAGLPVRGGHPSETVVLLNHATLRHPFRAENVGGTGLFSVVETATMKKLYFSSGGFSVKYGGALSGVLDIDTESRVVANRIQLDANLVSAGVGLRHRVVDDRVNLQVYAKHTSTGLLYRVNEPSIDIIEHPRATAVTGILNYSYSRSGLLQFLILESSDDQTLEIPISASRGDYRLRTHHRVVSLNGSDVLGPKVFMRHSISVASYDNDWSFTSWSRNNSDQNLKTRSDVQWDVGDGTSVGGGFELSRDAFTYHHLLPRRRGEFFAGADSVQLDRQRRFVTLGGYAEVKKRIFRKTTVVSGIRLDRHGRADRTSTDVRGGMVYELNDGRFLRLGIGTFHQFPDVLLYESFYSTASLKPMRAKHVVVGYEERQGSTELRVEAYSKWYSRLPLENAVGLLTSDGNGYAYGVDVFLKGRWKRVNGWLSYSFIHTRRREFDVPTTRPTAYDVTHNLKLIQKTSLGKGYEMSSTLRYATGRPVTDIVDAAPAQDGSWIPEYGPRFGDRLPDFVRLDARLSRFFFFSDAKYLVLYIEAINVLNHHNVLDYSYSADFTERQRIISYFGNRTVVAGFSLSL